MAVNSVREDGDSWVVSLPKSDLRHDPRLEPYIDENGELTESIPASIQPTGDGEYNVVILGARND